MTIEHDSTPDHNQTLKALSAEAALRGLHEALAEFCRVRAAAAERPISQLPPVATADEDLPAAA
jgi:hypothetical protein